MDGLPVVEHLERLNEAFVRSWWHWWFLGQTDKPAERVINLIPTRGTAHPSAVRISQTDSVANPCAIDVAE
jgi:hypothetical protein